MSSTGLSTGLANSWLGTLRNVPYTVGVTAVKLHTGIPGTGSSNASAVTTRRAATFAAPSGATMSLTGGAPTWDMTTAETITHISVWSDLSSGVLLWTAVMNIPRVVANGDTFSLNACDLTLTGLAS
jgi:hypothetical protein